jgi:hypothetical protein
MKYTLYRNPTLFDFIEVCYALPEDEREQFATLSGKPYDPNVVAAQYFLRDCPKWVLCADDKPLCVAGFDYVRPGVWQDWMFSTPAAWSPAHWRTVTKNVRKVMDGMLVKDAHRLQCISLKSRIQAHKWYRVLGLVLEGELEGYGINGENALVFKRMKEENDGR